jgi:hypothetical protein
MFNDISVMNDENFNTDFNIFTFRWNKNMQNLHLTGL